MRADVQSPADVITDEIERIIAKLARDVAERLRSCDRYQARQDIAQALRLVALQEAPKYRGDNGATLATFLYRALRVKAWSVGFWLDLPTHVAKNKRTGVWTTRTAAQTDKRATDARAPRDDLPPAEAMDLIRDPEDLESRLADREIAARVEAVLHEDPQHEAIARVLFDGEKAPDVARDTGVPIGDLRKCIVRTRARLRRDPTLQELYFRCLA